MRAPSAILVVSCLVAAPLDDERMTGARPGRVLLGPAHSSTPGRGPAFVASAP